MDDSCDWEGAAEDLLPVFEVKCDADTNPKEVRDDGRVVAQIVINDPEVAQRMREEMAAMAERDNEERIRKMED